MNKPQKPSRAAQKAHPAPVRSAYKTPEAYTKACQKVSNARIAFDAKREPEKKRPGRPTVFKEEYIEQAKKLCLLGSTDIELADFFGVVESTIHKWKIDYPHFSESIKEGKEIADAQVASKLYHRAIGYSHDSVKIFANPNTGKESIIPFVEHYPPETTACIFWLKNRQKGKWRDKQDLEHTGANGGPMEFIMESIANNPQSRLKIG